MGSYAQMVVDNELAGSVLRVRKGFSADTEALAVDVVAAVMASTRNFLGQKHTMKNLKSGEVFITIWQRGPPGKLGKGWPAGIDRTAQEEAERILRSHQVPPLDASQERELDTIMLAAEKELVR